MTKRELADAISRDTKFPHTTTMPIIQMVFKLLQDEIIQPSKGHETHTRIILIPCIGKLTYTPASYTATRNGGDLSQDKTGKVRMYYKQATLKFEPLPPIKEFLRNTRITIDMNDQQNAMDADNE